MSLKIIHDLSRLSTEELEQYKRDVSAYIGLPGELNGLDTIWMDNESGPGRSLVLYARRGTAEVLRNNLGIEVTSLTDKMVNGSIVFTATGKNGKGRQEIATGSKYLGALIGKVLDDAVMTASTRALRRLTMQFTSLGLLDQSEVEAVVSDLSNPAAAATLAGSPMVIPAPVAANNAPGKVVEAPAPQSGQNDLPAHLKAIHEDAAAFLKARDAGAVQAAPEIAAKADIKADMAASVSPVTPVVLPVTPDNEAAKEAAKFESSPEQPTRPRRARKQKNTVSMEVEPETVSAPAPAAAPPQVHSVAQNPPAPVFQAPGTHELASISELQARPNPSPGLLTGVPIPGTSVPNSGTDFPGKPTDAQMADYRKRVSVYTSELPSSENMGSVQKMRAFITKTSGTAPQFMSTEQWEEMLSFFESFVSKNTTKGLIKYINDSLGVK
jgi:hypothetical protein